MPTKNTADISMQPRGIVRGGGSDDIRRSNKGKSVNMSMLRLFNEGSPAVTGGGQKMNAKGDYLDKNGQVVKTAEDLYQEWVDYKEAEIKGEAFIRDPEGRKVSMADDRENAPTMKLRPRTRSSVANPFKKKWNSRRQYDRENEVPNVQGENAKKLVKNYKEETNKGIPVASDHHKNVTYKRKLVNSTDKDEGNAL